MALDYGTRYYKLAGVKECLYHPRLPTFRRIDMDTIAHKLPHEHCRTTTPCSKDNFNNKSATIGLRIVKPFTQNGLGKSSKYRNIYNLKAEDDENEAKETKPDSTNKGENGQAPFQLPYPRLDKGYWRFTLQQEPYIDSRGRRPIPATTFSRYRNNSSLYGGQVSCRSWRP